MPRKPIAPRREANTSETSLALRRRGPRARGFFVADPGGEPRVVPFTSPDDVVRGDGTVGPPAGGGIPSDTVEPLDGVGDAGVATEYSRGDHKHADANRPTDDEKAALAGTGTPSNLNRYVTADTLAALAAAVGKRTTVRVATTGDVTIATALNAGDSIDGVTLVAGDLVLVKSQSAQEQNGIYAAGVSPARDAQFDTYDEHPGSLIVVQEGSTLADTLWMCTSNTGGTLNTTAIVFSQISVSAGINQLTGDVTAGPGSGSQAATIANNAVTDAQFRQSAGLSLPGRSANSTGNIADITAGTDNQVMRRSGTSIGWGAVNLASSDAVTGTLPSANLPTAVKTRAITFVIDGGGSTITTGIKGDLSIPFACTITGVRLLADQSGAIVVDIWKDTYANYPPTDSPDSITASAPPTITASGVKSEDTTLTGWTTSIGAGDTLRFNVDSVTSIQRVTLTLTVTV